MPDSFVAFESVDDNAPTWDDVFAEIGAEFWKLAPKEFADSGHRDLKFLTNWQDLMAAVDNAVERAYAADGTRTNGIKVSQQWAVRKRSIPDGEGFGLPFESREEAEAKLARFRSSLTARYPVESELVQREVRRWADGSCWIGPWVEVPV